MRPLPNPKECDFTYDSDDPPELWEHPDYWTELRRISGRGIPPEKAAEAARLGRIMPVGRSLQFFAS